MTQWAGEGPGPVTGAGPTGETTWSCRKTTPVLTIVVPCFNEEDGLAATVEQLEAEISRLAAAGAISSESHLLLVDDGSSDGTWAVIRRAHERSRAVRGVKLSRNRGHQSALMAGLQAAQGDAVISMDADLQDDITVISGMVDRYRGGADVVLGVRDDRSSDAWFKRVSAQVFYRMLTAFGVENVYNHADCRLLSRRALDGLKQYSEVNLYLRALVLQLGFPVAVVAYRRAPRNAGTTKYGVLKMLALGMEGITSFSIRPLRYITLLGFVISMFSFLLTAWALIAAVMYSATVPGWASTVIPIYFVCGIQMICLGVIGEYIGKIYFETKRRPRYFVEEALWPPDQDARESEEMPGGNSRHVIVNSGSAGAPSLELDTRD